MIALWMVSATVFALCLGLAATAAERWQRLRGRSARGVWVGALVLGVAWPAVVPAVHLVRPPASGIDVGAPVAAMPVEPLTVSGEASTAGRVLATLAAARTSVSQRLAAARLGLIRSNADAPLLALWALTSLLLGVQLWRAARGVQRLTAESRPTRVDGEAVRLSDRFGPASVGWRAPEVVLPAWVLTLDPPLRAMVLRHEREHCRARDPRLVWLAAFAVVLTPWNVAVWWIAQRLRLAVELDCDARTLAAWSHRPHEARLTYGKLLLFMTQQLTAAPRPLRLASSLASSRSHLHARIHTMQRSLIPAALSSTRRQRALSGALAAIALAAACGTDIPGNLTATSGTEAPGTPASTLATADSASVVADSVAARLRMLGGDPANAYFEFQVDEPVRMQGAANLRYPAMLRSAQVEGTVLASFVVGTDGRVDTSTFRVLRSDHDLFANSVKQALGRLRYSAARVGGQPVRQLVQQPFAFRIDRPRAMEEPGVTVTAVTEGSATPSNPARRGFSDGAEALSRANAASANAPRAAYFEFQVDKPASMQARSSRLSYPPSLRAAGVSGTVLASFVVDEGGRVDMRTFKVLRTDHALFTESVRTALPEITYEPAEVSGQRVKQLVQQPFVFQLAK